jgi:hypothetical protein
MADEEKPRSNRGKYNEANYSPTRRAFIEMARSRGLTSAADRAKVAAMAAKGASRGKVSEEVIDIPDPVPSLSMDDLSPTEKYRKNYEDIFGRKEKKAKGGLVGRGQGKAIKIKTTKFY